MSSSAAVSSASWTIPASTMPRRWPALISLHCILRIFGSLLLPLRRRPLAPRQVERAPQQLDGALGVARRPQIQTNPAGVGQDVMRLGQAGGHYLVAHA